MFRRVLIANRGEIAVRVAHTLQQMGITVVAVHSDPDRDAPHVHAADEVVPLPGTTPAETYLKVDSLLEIARASKVDAIHPGYGFLSENADFAKACADASITFIGPSPDVIRTMGDKLVAKKIFADAGVPVVPGFSLDASLSGSKLKHRAKQLGYPILIKAAAGGGGKGMRIVEDESQLDHALESAAREAGSAFGDDRVFIEKLIDRPRHVEFQIFGDHHGHFVHLFERECSIQRRHQKIIEESPSPALTPKLRKRMGDAAVRAARAVGYTNAGTVEFMLDADGKFYFLEVNTRLQVEHPVTEMTVHHDLVRAQVLVAAGEPLPFTQQSLAQTGHAIEARIYAEDPSRGFLPSTGTLSCFDPPTGPFIRVDTGVQWGCEVSVHYDPMLAKLIVSGRDRQESLDRLAWALRRFAILGVTTNIEFLQALIDHPAFRAGELHTKFLEEHDVEIADKEIPDEAWALAAWALTRPSTTSHSTKDGDPGENAGPWMQDRAWRAF